MLFVMFIVGLTVALIAPRFGFRIDHIENLSRQHELEDQIRQLPRRVRLAGHRLELPKDLEAGKLGDGAPVLDIPNGWSVAFDPALLIAANGACSATTITIALPTGEIAERLKLAEVSCEPSSVAK